MQKALIHVSGTGPNGVTVSGYIYDMADEETVMVDSSKALVFDQEIAESLLKKTGSKSPGLVCVIIPI